MKAAWLEGQNGLPEQACREGIHTFCETLVLSLPVDVLLHEQVEAVVKVAPHVRVKMNPPNALWVRGSLYPVQLGDKAAPTVHYNVSGQFSMIIYFSFFKKKHTLTQDHLGKFPPPTPQKKSFY